MEGEFTSEILLEIETPSHDQESVPARDTATEKKSQSSHASNHQFAIDQVNARESEFIAERRRISAHQFQCFFCPFFCELADRLEAHIKKRHKTLKPMEVDDVDRFRPQEDSEPLIETFNCSECEFTSQARRAFLNHYESVHMQVLAFKCLYCDFRAKQASVRNKHLEEKHRMCSQCDFEGFNYNDLEDHKKIYHAKNPEYICSQCGMSFSSEGLLRTHVSVFHLSAFSCSKCDFSSDVAYTLYLHLERVHNEMFFSCNQCEFGSTSASGMADHLSSHGIKSYLCELCGYKTTRLMFLKRHYKARHTERYLKCPFCPFTNSQRWSLKQHIVQVHEKTKMFPCPHCPHQAASRGNLNVHIKSIHINDKRFVCPVCSFKTSIKSTLLKHLSKNHQNAALNLDA